MTTSESFFSLIQFFPDLDRSEGVNVGVLLYAPKSGRVYARFSTSNDLVRRRFPGRALDDARLNYAKVALRERLEAKPFETREDLEHFADSLGNNLAILPLRPTLVTSIQEELDELMQTLVHEPVTPSERQTAELEQIAKTYLTPVQLGAKVRWHVKDVTVPVIGRTIKVNFAYLNGSLNYVKTHAFTAEHDATMAKAGTSALNGMFLAKHPIELEGNEVKQHLIVLASFADLSMRPKVSEMFRECDVEMVEAKDIEKFAERVRRDAH